MKSKTNKIFILVVFVLTIFFDAKISRALTVSPVLSELKGDPGQTVKFEVFLYNDQKETKTYYLDYQSFEAKDESGKPALFKSRIGLPTWMSSTNESIVLGPGQRTNVPIEIKIPRDAEPGGNFAAVLFRNEPPRSTDGDGAVGIASEVGSLVLLRVNGEIIGNADILEFRTKDNKSVFKSLPIDFYVRFQNSSSEWVKPLGDIEIKNFWGGIQKLIPANPDGANVLSSSVRRFEASWLTRAGGTQNPQDERVVEPARYWDRVLFQAKYSPIGRFTANVTLNFGDGYQNKATSSLVFWVLPWELLSIALPSVFILLFILRFAVKAYNRHIIKKATAKKRATRSTSRKRLPKKEVDENIDAK